MLFSTLLHPFGHTPESGPPPFFVLPAELQEGDVIPGFADWLHTHKTSLTSAQLQYGTHALFFINDDEYPASMDYYNFSTRTNEGGVPEIEISFSGNGGVVEISR